MALARAGACDHRPVQDGSLIPRFGRARRDRSLAVLEGFHPLKHALRFGANVLEAACSDRAELDRLAELLAPDLAARMHALAREVEPEVFEQLSPLAPSTGRPLLAVDPEGEQLDPLALPPRAILAFGSERYGLSRELTARADGRVRIPMRPGVSSLNLATSVAAVLFSWRLCGRPISLQ